jgi:hypothetical protein
MEVTIQNLGISVTLIVSDDVIDPNPLDVLIDMAVDTLKRIEG